MCPCFASLLFLFFHFSLWSEYIFLSWHHPPPWTNVERNPLLVFDSMWKNNFHLPQFSSTCALPLLKVFLWRVEGFLKWLIVELHNTSYGLEFGLVCSFEWIKVWRYYKCADQLSIREGPFESSFSWRTCTPTISNWRGTVYCLQTVWSCKGYTLM